MGAPSARLGRPDALRAPPSGGGPCRVGGSSLTSHVLLYDSDCGFCRWAVDRILAWDRGGRLRPVALQSAEADRLLPGLDPQTKMATWHLVAPDGRVSSGGAVAAPILRLLPGGGPLVPIASAFPGLAERAYRLVAGNRDRFGRLAGARCEVDPGRRRASETRDE